MERERERDIRRVDKEWGGEGGEGGREGEERVRGIERESLRKAKAQGGMKRVEGGMERVKGMKERLQGYI